MTEAWRPLTQAEQRLAYLEGLKRPLTEEESDDLRRAMHAVYVYQQKQRAKRLEREMHRDVLEKHRAEELALLGRLVAETRG